MLRVKVNRASTIGLQWLVAGAVFALAALFSYHNALRLPWSELATFENMDAWFGADIFRVVMAETDAAHKAHYRNNVHPFFSVVMFPFNALVGWLTGAGGVQSVLISHALMSGALASAIYALARRESDNTLAALLLAALACASAGFIFWTCVPETFALGALTIAVAMVFHGSKQPYSPVRWILANLTSLSMTITNFSVSVISMFLLLTRRQMVRVLVGTLVLATALALLQKAVFPQSGLFFLGLEQEAGYVQLTRRSVPEVLLKVLDRGVVFLSAGFMLPGIHTPEVVRASGLPSVLATSLLQGRAPALQWLGLLAWWSLLVMAVRHALRTLRHRRVSAVALIFWLGQFLLHLLYGDETFLYVLHSLPAVMVLMAALFRTRHAHVAWVLVAVTLVISAYGNYALFLDAVALLQAASVPGGSG